MVHNEVKRKMGRTKLWTERCKEANFSSTKKWLEERKKEKREREREVRVVDIPPFNGP
jgi:hypothetical protein